MRDFFANSMRLLSLLFLATILGCSPPQPQLKVLTGNAQGSTYQIRYISSKKIDFNTDLEQIFKDVDLSMSTWIPTSLISRINESGDWVEVDDMFLEVLNRSIEIAKESGGEFDPTVGPLVQLWGFWFDEIRSEISAKQVVKTLGLIGYDKIEIDGKNVRIPQQSTIDFNAITQGYTVDVIAEALEEKGIFRYMVEVGGEVRTQGLNDKNSVWIIGVDKPQENIDVEDRFQFILRLEDAALATSGNYRKFWVDEATGLKYSHTIDPKTGYPSKTNMLSASVFSETCFLADAFATSFMVMGFEKSKKLSSSIDEIEVLLIYYDNNGEIKKYLSDGIKEKIKLIE